MSLSAIVTTLVTVWLALGVAAPTLVDAQQQPQIALRPSKSQPIVCIGGDGKPLADAISVAAYPSFAQAPFDQVDPRQYEFHLYNCASDKGCFAPDGKPRWQVWNHSVQQCDNRNCGKWALRPNPPRPMTVYFVAFVQQKAAYGSQRLTGARLLQVPWTYTGQRCPNRPLPPGLPEGQDARVQFGWMGININGQLTRQTRQTLPVTFKTGSSPDTTIEPARM